MESKKLLDSGLTFEWQLEEPTTHLFKRNCVADLKKTRSSPYVLPRKVW